MTGIATFYLSQIIGKYIIGNNRKTFGKLQDLVVDLSFSRPKVIAVKVKMNTDSIFLDYKNFNLIKRGNKLDVKCHQLQEIEFNQDNTLFLAKHVLDNQLVDINGVKLVRVNDIRLVTVDEGTFAIAVDVGIDGLFRRLALDSWINMMLGIVKKSLPGNFILWEDIATIDYSHKGITLSKTQEKLSKLHPSDLADIIEDMDYKAQAEVFASLNDEQAADVLEELEADVQVNLIENMSVEKAADVLEKMPADEAADILEDMEEGKAEELLAEMENKVSEEVRALLKYPENTVGSLMTTEFIAFNKNVTVNETLQEFRKIKPTVDSIYYIYLIDENKKLIATVSLRDLVVSDPDVKLSSIMSTKLLNIKDYDKIDSLAEMITKYNLLAIPVVDATNTMKGVVIIDDVIFTLLKSRKRKTLVED